MQRTSGLDWIRMPGRFSQICVFHPAKPIDWTKWVAEEKGKSNQSRKKMFSGQYRRPKVEVQISTNS